MGWPGTLLSKWYSVLSASRITLGNEGVDLFAHYLDTNATVRFYVAGTTGWGHQTASVLLVRRLCQPTTAQPFAFGYTGAVEVYIDARTGGGVLNQEPYATTLDKLMKLMPELVKINKTQYRFFSATVEFFEYDPTHPPEPVVHLGFTGGSDGVDGVDHVAAGLNTDFFLRLQPYRWTAPNQVQYLSDNWPYVELDQQYVLGKSSFVQRAYVQPVSVPDWDGRYQNDQQAQIIQWLTADAQQAQFDFCPIYSIRDTKSELGAPGQRLAFVLAAVLAAEIQDGGRPAVVVNLDVYEPASLDVLNYEYGFRAIVELLGNRIGFETDEYYLASAAARKAAVAPLLVSERDRLDWFQYDPTRGDNLTALQTMTGWLLTQPDTRRRVLYVQLGRRAAKIAPPVFAYAFAKATLPGVFEGQNTANLALNIGQPYFHVNRPTQPGTQQYPSEILSAYGGSARGRELQATADTITTSWPQWPTSANPLLRIPAFVRAYRAEAADGPYHTYFGGMRTFYRNRLEDKFNLSLCFFNYLIDGHGSASRLLGAGATVAPGGETLASIFAAFSKAAQPGQPVPFLQQLDQSAPIATFIAGVEGQLGTAFVTTNTAVTREPAATEPIKKVTVTGATQLFGAGPEIDVDAEFTTPNGIVVLTCRFTGAVAWSPSGLPWIAFANPFLEFTVADSPFPVAGKVGGRLVGPDVDFYAVLPPNDGALLFAGDFVSPPSIDKFFRLAGGVNLLASLPPPLNIISRLELTHVEFGSRTSTDPLSFSIEYFFFLLKWAATAGQGWQLVPNVTLNDLAIGITVPTPGSASSVRAEINGTFTIGSGADAGVIAVGVTAPELTFSAQLTQGEIKLTDLIQIFIPFISINPPSQPAITRFSFNGVQKTGDYTLSCGLGFSFSLPPSGPALLTLEDIGLLVTRAAGQTTGQLTGSFTLLRDDPANALTLALTAEYVDDPQHAGQHTWQFSGRQSSADQRLSLVALMAKYLGGWQPPQDYGINGLYFTATPSNSVYAFGGKTAEPWQVPFIPGLTIAASLDLAYDQSQQPSPYSGSLSAVVSWSSIEIDLKSVFGKDGSVYSVDWGAFHAEVKKNAKGEWVAAGSLTGVTLGGLIEDFVSFATGSRFGLGAPWNLLDSVPLDALQLTFNFTTRQVGFGVDIGGIDLGFASIDGVTINYDSSTADRKVMVTLTGRFPWTSELKPWDATKPETTPAPPGGGNELLDLRLLALGQHVSIVGSPEFTSVTQAIDALRNIGPDDAPVAGPNASVAFDPNNSWLVATDFGLMKVKDESQALAAGDDQYTVSLAIVFDDPNLYALRIALAGPAAKVLSGLVFEVLYRRISDTIGVYQAEITLPDAMRNFDVGVYSLTLPVIAVAVYTNGDFTIDIGFPWNLDFSRSFTVQAVIAGIPVMGSGGFYFGKLSSETSTQVPKATNGRFDPVIIFGFGAQVGVGKSVSYGILKAGFSLTIFGVIQGVIAKWCPNTAGTDVATKGQLQDSYYFDVQGTFGIIGGLYGYVDFAIIKASVSVSIKVYVQITYISYQDIPISLVASVDVEASIDIDFGLFSITISFSFSMTIKETFTIKNSGTAPWQVAPTERAALMAAAHQRRLRGARPRLFVAIPNGSPTLTWSNLVAADSKTALTGYLAPALTVSGDMAQKPADQRVCYVMMLAIASGDPTVKRQAGDADTSFDLLAQQVLRWVIAATLNPNPPHPAYTSSYIDNSVLVSDDDLAAILGALSDPAVPMPIPPDAIDTFMGSQFVMTVTAPTTAGTVNAAPFPASPKLVLDVAAYGNVPELTYAFADFNGTSVTYLDDLRTYFDQLAVQVEQEAAAPPRLMAAAGGPSVATFVFADYFRLIARQMIESARDALRSYKYPLQPNDTIGTVVTWAGNAGAPSFTRNDLFEANAAHALISSQPVVIHGATVQARAGATLTSIAADDQNLFSAGDLAKANHASITLLTSGATVAYLTQPAYVVQARDTLDAVATHFGVSLDTFLTNAPATLTQSGLIAPLALLALPDFTYPATAGDSPSRIAQRFGIAVAALAIPANDGVRFDAGAGATLDLPHLPALKVGPLVDEIKRTNGLSRIGGMTGRYSLHGLRLPTDGVTANYPCSCGSPLPSDCGLYALTGQQFAAPPLAATAFSFSLVRPSSDFWMAFGGASRLTMTLQPPPATDANWAKVQALQAFLASPAYRVAPPGTSVGPQTVYRDLETTWPATSLTVWQNAGPVTLPYPGTAPSGVQTLRLWGLPDALLNLDDAQRKAPPRAAPMRGNYDEATGQTVETPLTDYGWVTRVSLTVKRLPASAGSPSTAYGYQLLGSGEGDIVLLERLLAATKGSSRSIDTLTLLYGATAASGAPVGLQSDDSTKVTLGILQANLSTVTNPPQLAARPQGAPAFAGCLNPPYDFVRLLWECSITRSGGYYLYYFDAGGGDGLPSRIFNDKGEATLTLLVVYKKPSDVPLRNLIPGFVNCLATGESFDAASSAVYTKSAPIATTASPLAGDSLASIGYAVYMDPIALAEANPGAQVAGQTGVVIRRGLYEVGPAAPGGDPTAIAANFGITLAALQAANPQVSDWSQPLDVYTALRLPALKVTVGTSPGGATFASLAAYYGTSIGEIAADNADVVGLLATDQSLAITGGPMSRSATVPIGCVAIEASRTPPQPPPSPADPQFARLFIENRLVLLGYRLAGNAWFTTTNAGLPIAHSGQPAAAVAADRTRTPLRAAPSAPWQFERAIPVARHASGVAKRVAGLPDPAQSPYAGVGGLAQVDLGWVDVFGNRAIAELGDNTGGAPPLNRPPLPVGYLDQLLALTQWPGVKADYQVAAVNGTPVFRFGLSFDPTGYSPPPPQIPPRDADPTAWQKRAAQALQVYDRLHYQLSQTLGPASVPAVTLALDTTLLPSIDLTFSTAQRDALTNWLFGTSGVYAFLVARVAGNTTWPAPADLPTDVPFALTGINPGQLYELAASFSLSRPATLVDPAFMDTPGYVTATTSVGPRLVKESDGTYRLTGFAKAIEGCLTQPGVALYKLASGVDRSHAMQPGETKPLWLVRLGLADAQAINFRIQNAGAPLRCAARPLYNTLQSRPRVNYYEYKTGAGIDFSKPSGTKPFIGVDVDVWMRELLEAVDTVFSPELLVPAALVDQLSTAQHQNWLTQLRTAKESLARSLSKLVIPVFTGEHPTDDQRAAAQSAVEQQALVALSNAYAINATVQFSASVNAAIDDPDGKEPPELYGTFLPGPGSDPGATITAAKLRLSSTPKGTAAPLTFLVTTAGKDAHGAIEKKLTLGLTYRGSHIEHQIGPLPAIDGYKASSWLSFVIPPTADATDWPLDASLGTFDVPLPLRVFPPPPSMVRQDTPVLKLKPPISWEKALEWTYDMSYGEDFHYPQDQTHFTTTFNVSDPRLKAAFVVADPVLDLAEFVTVYPRLQADLLGVLAHITQASDQAAVDLAGVALNAFLQLTQRVAASFASFVAASGSPGARGRIGAAERGQDPYVYTVAESAVDKKNPDGRSVSALLVGLTPAPPSGIDPPSITIDGYKIAPSAAPTGFRYGFCYTDASGNYLTAVDGQRIARRTVVLPGLNILAAQSALTSAVIERNQDLVDGHTTADAFVYQTAPTAFPTALRPTVDVPDPLDIAAFGGAPVTRTFADQLDHMLTTLFARAPAGPQTVQVAISYTISLNNALPDVGNLATPILLLPPTAFQPAAAASLRGGARDTVLTQAGLIATLRTGVYAWFAAYGPPPGGDLVFDMTVMTSMQGPELPPMPLLDLEKLTLHYENWSDPPAVPRPSARNDDTMSGRPSR